MVTVGNPASALIPLKVMGKTTTGVIVILMLFPARTGPPTGSPTFEEILRTEYPPERVGKSHERELSYGETDINLRFDRSEVIKSHPDPLVDDPIQETDPVESAK